MNSKLIKDVIFYCYRKQTEYTHSNNISKGLCDLIQTKIYHTIINSYYLSSFKLILFPKKKDDHSFLFLHIINTLQIFYIQHIKSIFVIIK